MHTTFLPLMRVFLFIMPPVAPLLGANEVGQGYNWPKSGNQGQGIEPWTHKKIMLQGQGLEHCTHRKIVLLGQGFEPWTDRKDHSYDHAHDR